jgi:hypothetical protein
MKGKALFSFFSDDDWTLRLVHDPRNSRSEAAVPEPIPKAWEPCIGSFPSNLKPYEH